MLGLTFGETVAIQGAGGLGVYAAGVAKARGASKIIAIDGVDERLDLIKEFGADEVVDIREFETPEERADAVRDLTDGLGTDVTLELVGHPGVVREGLDMTAHGGRYLEIGNINVGWDTEFDPSVIVFKSISVIGVAHYKAQDLRNALNFLVDYKDQLPFDRILSHQFPLSQIDHAMEQQDKGVHHAVGVDSRKLEVRRVRLVDGLRCSRIAWPGLGCRGEQPPSPHD